MSSVLANIYPLPTIAVVSATVVILSIVTGCGGTQSEPENPTHQWAGSDDVQFYPDLPDVKLLQEWKERAAEKQRENSVDAELR